MSPSFDTLAAIAVLIVLAGGCLAILPHVLQGVLRTEAWLWVAAIVMALGAAGLRVIWVPPHHAMFVDEPWYLEAARNLIERFALVLCRDSTGGILCDPYPKAAGWPVLLAGAFTLFGASSDVAFALSVFLGVSAVLLSAVVTRLAGGAWHQAMLAALLVALHPLHVAWSPTAETNVAATAILLMGIAAILRLRHAPALSYTCVAAGALGFAAAMRPELSMAVPPAVVLLARSRPRAAMLVLLCGALGATSVTASWGLYLSNSSGTFLSPQNLAPNFGRLLAPAEGGALTLFMIALSTVSSIALLRRRDLAVLVLLGGSSLLIAAIAVGYDQRIFYPRTVLGSIVLLAPLAALALPRPIAAAAGILAMVLAVPGLRLVHTVSVTQMLETRLSRAIAAGTLPDDAVVIAEWPTIVAAATGRTAMSAADAASHPGGIAALAQASTARPHFMLCDMFCETKEDADRGPACRDLLNGLALDEVVAVTDNHRRYGLYRIVGPLQAGQPRTPCPLAHQ